eukprot:4027960-Pyramimonas_sp.AAC.1
MMNPRYLPWGCIVPPPTRTPPSRKSRRASGRRDGLCKMITHLAILRKRPAGIPYQQIALTTVAKSLKMSAAVRRKSSAKAESCLGMEVVREATWRRR